jgi:hypothetical protein
VALVYDGHTFAGTRNECTCCTDAAVAVIDPTNTSRLRGRFKQDFGLRWNKLRIAVRDILTKLDILSLRAGGLESTASPALAAKGEAFQRWFDNACDKVLIGGQGAWMRPYLSEAFAEGTAFGTRQVNTDIVNDGSSERSDALQMLARIELQGIAQAVSQQATRAVMNGLLTEERPMNIVRNVWAAIDKIGRLRTDALVELLVVRAHVEATLDVYEANGIATVGLLPEAVAARTLGARDAARKSKAKTSKKVARPGSRSRGAVPSKRTIQRVRALELKIAKQLGEKVNVETAGDENVCPVCEGISEGGPYTINRARALIPAHPRCRCVFVPVSSADDE